MPQPPSWIDKVNFITDYWSSPCSASWYVYTKHAWAAFGRVALVLVDFGLDDIVRSTFRPKGLRTGRHGRKGRKGRRLVPSIPEPSDLVADRALGRDIYQARYTDGLTKNLWRLDGVGQKALNRYMLVNLVTDFFYDWGTGIIDDPLSDCEHRAEGQSRKHAEAVYLGVAGWQAIGFHDIEEERGGVQLNPFGAFLPSLGFRIIIAIKCKRGFPEDRERRVMMRLVNQSGDILANSSLIDVPEGTTTDLIFESRFYGPGGINFLILPLNGNVIVTEGLVWIQQMTGNPND